mmetsp:Transcript_11678/g.38252  ORF Transcript_11678/g.38252 Transcript_11678/m.38252 type:complete len:204 (+) Transcript_11678:1037-1648(+)
MIEQLGSFYAIPSRSMEATLAVGDVIFAEKVSRLVNLPYERGDLVLFSPPAELQQQVRAAGGTLGGRDLFVKRVAAIGGDKVALTPEGGIVVNGEPRAAPPLQCAGPRGGGGGIKAESGGEPRAVTFARVVPDGSLFVLGDCPERSTDSRTWGPLPRQNVVARPVVRVWPISRRGTIDASADLNPFARGRAPHPPTTSESRKQ